MSRRFMIVLLCAAGLCAALPTFPQSGGSDIRFTTVDVFLRTDEPVAAWQFELREASGRMRVVGVENGDSAAFGEAPYYDVAAVTAGTAERVIVADYSLSPPAELPSGRIRVATVHLQIDGSGDPDYVLSLVAAGGADGAPIRAAIEIGTP